MKLTLVARDISGVVVGRATIGDGERGFEQSKIFLQMAQQYEIRADRVDAYSDDVQSPRQADFVIDPREMTTFFESCATQELPILSEAVDLLKTWGRTGDMQWRIQHIS